jgi:hypothetical protein
MVPQHEENAPDSWNSETQLIVPDSEPVHLVVRSVSWRDNRAMTPNKALNLTAQERRSWVPVALRAPAAG